MGSAESSLSEKVDEKRIRKEIGECPVVIYTKSECGYCKMAKDLLGKERINYKEHELGQMQREDPTEYQKRVNGLVYITRHQTMPQVFICESFIGGFTELNKLYQEGQLKEEISRSNSSSIYWHHHSTFTNSGQEESFTNTWLITSFIHTWLVPGN